MSPGLWVNGLVQRLPRKTIIFHIFVNNFTQKAISKTVFKQIQSKRYLKSMKNSKKSLNTSIKKTTVTVKHQDDQGELREQNKQITCSNM